ncbi:MAG: bifunctional (p)ppGpp synthetase/guanosine-3',5'-bis(diphosphate) 3'-pyrophosphohydrolase [Clostridia bacterium]|nr:bifunctional (p)ppGpp synthetase/guanosine-3',5'-bis(diphosphate) 3'-pyrophosphohydrolase [Clostridia bacterium]MBR6511994.1 bifunctional (p)ppGpp synthetase/guanosine-3',5'-bis(diphosphate) 3'-pyrophosphohydrolase [Clostridia bacterium]
MAEYDDKFGELKKRLSEQYSEAEIEKVTEAYKFAKEAHKGQCRYSGEPYIMHPVAVAGILFDLGMDYESLMAALLHDTIEDTGTGLDKLRELFGEDVANLVDGVTKLGKVPLETREERQAENVRKMFIAMSKDIRVVIIKLADRLHNMRTLEYMRDQKRRDKAQETLEIYAPIAHRLGIRTVKEELEDLSIRYLDPVGYKEIEDLVNRNDKVHPNFIPDTIAAISERVHELIPDAKIDGRRKSVHGIYRKMYIQNREFDEIYDVYAIRIIVDNVVDCYNCLGIIHDMYHSLPGRFKDYISTPKSNMYQSLHSTVISPEGIPFEIQIRTWEMHHTAEYGIAAHWKYKLGVSGKDGDFEQRLAWVRQVLESQQDSDDVEDLVTTLKTDFVPDDVFVFTPKGDVINIPYGSTVIDFAYAIHTQVGHKMTGAKVDGRIVPIDYKVKTGQIVEILRSNDPNKGPSRDWLNIAKTSSARTKIRGWFKKERREENIEEGKAEFEKELRKNGIRLFDEELEGFIRTLAEKKGFDDIDEFFAAIGYRSISLEKLMPFMKDEYTRILKASEGPRDEIVVTAKPHHSASPEGIVVEGIDNCLVKLAKCCNPLPGDDIIGFVTRGHGVSVHKRDCTNVPFNIKDSAEPERWIKVYWDANVKEEFNSTLDIYCISRIGLMAEVSTTLATMHVDIRSISTRDLKDGTKVLTMTIAVNGVEHLNNVIRYLKKIDGVLSVERTGV